MKEFRFEKLDVKRHDRKSFVSGNEELDQFFQTQARQQMEKRLSVCFVMLNGESKIIGFYTLSSASIDTNESRISSSKYVSIPVVLIGRLAVHSQFQKQGLGGLMLVNIIERVRKLSESEIGVKGIFVEPKSEEISLYYLKYGFLKLEKGVFYPFGKNSSNSG
jgi:predicted N-acetyltransferase YhbS